MKISNKKIKKIIRESIISIIREQEEMTVEKSYEIADMFDPCRMKVPEYVMQYIVEIDPNSQTDDIEFWNSLTRDQQAELMRYINDESVLESRGYPYWMPLGFYEVFGACGKGFQYALIESESGFAEVVRVDSTQASSLQPGKMISKEKLKQLKGDSNKNVVSTAGPSEERSKLAPVKDKKRKKIETNKKENIVGKSLEEIMLDKYGIN